MEQRNGQQPHPPYVNQTPFDRFLSSPENGYPFRSENSPVTDPFTHSHQTLEDAFSSLNIWSMKCNNNQNHRPIRPASLNGDVLPPPIAGEGFNSFVPFGFQEREINNTNFETLRALNNNRIGGFCVGPPQNQNPFVDLGGHSSFLNQPYNYRDYVCASSEFDQSLLHSFLLHKQHHHHHQQQLLYTQLDSQLPTFPCCSNTGNFDGLFNGNGNSVIVHKNSHNRYNLGSSNGNGNSVIVHKNSHNRYNLGSSNKVPDYLNYLSLKDLRGKIIYLAKDQNGSRILQNKFENPNEEEIETVLSEVIDFAGDLMKNQFGNYLINKLVSVCNDEQRTQIIRSLTKSPFQLIGICMNPHGTRAVQKLLENLTNSNQVNLVMSALTPGAAALANDSNGHHVILYCLTHFSNESNKHIINNITDNCFGVATDRSGCCVLQACMEHTKGESRKHLVDEIIANSVQLAEDPYGNYVLQHMLGLGIDEITEDLVRQLEGNYATLSRNKYASNVVEKCLTESGEALSTLIILELVRSPNASMLLLDPFANFVIQSALKVSKGFAYDCMHNLIVQNTSLMRNNLYGKKILGWFEKRKMQQL